MRAGFLRVARYGAPETKRRVGYRSVFGWIEETKRLDTFDKEKKMNIYRWLPGITTYLHFSLFRVNRVFSFAGFASVL